MLDVGRERHDLRKAPVLRIGERIDVERGNVSLDLPVEPVENVVHTLGFRDPLVIAPVQRIEGAGEHRLEYIGHAQRLAGGPGKRNRRRLARRAIEVHRPRRVGRIYTRGEQFHQQFGKRPQDRKKQQRQHDVERRMKIGHGAAGIGVDRDEFRANPIQHSEPSAHPTTRLIRLPIGRRFAAGSPLTPLSIRGLIAVPRLAPRTSANAACGGMTP